MKANSGQKTRGLYEYIIWDNINRHNELMDDVNLDDITPIIMASEGRVLNSKLVQYLKERNLTLDTAGMESFTSSFDEVFSDRLGSKLYPDGSNSKLFKEQMGNFLSITGFGNATKNDLAVFPISPYDSRFADRESVRKNGSQLSGVVVDDVSVLDNFDDGFDIDVMKARETDKGIKWSESENKLSTISDLVGLTPLMGYMTESEFNNASIWMGKSVSNSDYSAESMKRRREMTEKSIAVLDGIGQMGVPYTIMPDTNPGQIKAVLTGTKINVRIMDTLNNENYIGRVYDNGANIFYSTTRLNGNSYARHEATPEDCLSLVKFALGKPVERWDDNHGHVGDVGIYEKKVKGQTKKFNQSFHNSESFVSVIGDYIDPTTGKKDPYGNKTLIRMTSKNRSATTSYFGDANDAEKYLINAVNSARDNFKNALDVDRLIDEYESHKDDLDYLPVFSGNQEIMIAQQGYWDLLTGKSDTLLRPSESAEKYKDLLSEVGEIITESPESKAMYNTELRNMTYDSDMTPIDIIKQHELDSIDYYIGSYDTPDENGKYFNPVGVATYQTSSYGVYRNNDDIVAALRMKNTSGNVIDGDLLKGDDYYNNTIKTRLITFDEDSAVPMVEHESEFIKNLYNDVHTDLTTNGAIFDEKDVLIDDNGIIHYNVMVETKQEATNSNSRISISGEIGQVFIPDEHGIIRTKFAGGDNYACVPGYEAEIIPQVAGELKSVEERTKLRGYEQILRENISYQLRQDFLKINDNIGSPTNINNVYRRLYDTRYPVNFVEQYKEQGMSEDILNSIIETQASRVRYSNVVRDGSTINADYRANAINIDMANDNFGDPYVLTGGRNMAILTEEGDGYFDPIATTSTSTNQGTLRFLTRGSKVDSEGFITPGDKNDKTSIMAHDIMKYSEYDPFDRQCMTLSNLMQASAITKPVNVAQMTFGGWNFDDPIVVSKNFADSYPIKNHNGDMRSLVIGDKLSDFHGNKGVISLVIDPEMSLEDAELKGIREQVEWFKANPNMDMVTAPFPAVSRFNGGTAREMMDNSSDLISPDGKVIEGGLGGLRMIVTDKSADAKTHIYDDAEVAQGKGRKISAQLAWALNSKDCPSIMAECYGANSGATTNLREMLITVGLDMDEKGNLRVGYQPHEGEERNVIEMGELIYNNKGSLNMKQLRSNFGDTIANSGGVLEIPFQLKYPTGEDMPPLDDGKRDVIYTKQQWEQRGYTRKDGTYVKGSTHTRQVESTKRQTDNISYSVPILSSYLRSGQSFADGTSSVHDYTNHYLNIFEQSVRYRDAEERLKDNGLSESDRKKYNTILDNAPVSAQISYDRIANDIKTRQFEGKHNMFRDDLMSRNMPKSATAIWSADPRLDIDELAMGDGIAESLGVKDGDYVMIWRDPVLRDSGVRYMKCKLNSELTGVAINPAMDKCFDGDFDGDTVGIVNLQSKQAKKEAFDKLSVNANLLDKGSRDSEGRYALAMQDSLDIKIAMHNNEDFRKRFNDITNYVNKFEAESDVKDVSLVREKVIEDMSTFYRDVFNSTVGEGIISSNDMTSHLDSVWNACIETGAKGSPGKFKDYMKYAGFKGEFNDDKLVLDSLEDNVNTLAVRNEVMGVQMATAVKSFGTGIAGKFSQRGVCNLRNECASSILELTYPVTQSILQSKHDPEDAKHKYDLLMGTVRDLWKGYKLEEDVMYGGWKTVRDEDYKPIQATTDEWKQQFVDIYTSSKGLNVNIENSNIDIVADALSDDNVMINIEAEDIDSKSFMDKMAYEGTFDILYEGAKENNNIFAGKFNEQFRPYIISQNIENASKSLDNESVAVNALVKSDVVNKQTRKVKADSISVIDKVRREPSVPDLKEGNEYLEFDV